MPSPSPERGLRPWLRRRVLSWARRRQGADPDPVALRGRRLYILPTSLGVAFAFMLAAMLIGGMNYNNSLGLALTFLLGGLAIVTMHHCHGNLSGLELRAAGAEPAFAGRPATFRITLLNASRRTRFGLILQRGDSTSESINLEPGAQATLGVEVPTEKRGTLALDRFGVYSTFPFGLFRCWAWVHPAHNTVVYPRPALPGPAPPPEHTDTGGARHDGSGNADFAGLRNFRDGDSPRHVAWKAYARDGELLVKQYAGTDVVTHWFDWNTVPHADVESRLERLTRWVLDAHGEGNAFGLRLPRQVISPDLGPVHLHRCLTALALFGAR